MLISDRYTTATDSIDDIFAHLDSIDLNKHNEDFDEFENDWEDEEITREGFRW